MKSRFSPDFWIQVVAFLFGVIVTVGGTVAFCFTTFATKDEIQVEREERREMKAEIDTLYNIQVPATERKPLAHHHDVGEKE